MLRRIEDRIACTPANTAEYAILKLMIYGRLQGYKFGTTLQAQLVSIDERLFFSVLADLKRLGPPNHDE